MIVGIDEVGNFDPNSKSYHFFVAVLIDQNDNKYNIKKGQYNIWESSIPNNYRDQKNEVKGQLLTDEQLDSFYHEVLKPKPGLLYSVVRLKPQENPKDVIDLHQRIEIEMIEKAYEMHKNRAIGNWADWYGRLLPWYKNRKPAHLLKMKCLQEIIGISFNYGIRWSQVSYILDNEDDSNISNFSYKIDKDFIRADNVKIIWNELLRQFWKNFVKQNRIPVLNFWKDGQAPVEKEYKLEGNKSQLKKVFRDRTHFLDSEDHFEIRIADIVGTIIHRYQNRGKCENIYKEIQNHIGGKRNNYLHLVLNKNP